jgi:hypothetical protein
MTTTPSTRFDPASREVREALRHPRVRRALHVTVRDEQMRRRFAELRGGGLRVDDAVASLTGPYEDEAGQRYFLSEERVRTIVYRKGQRPSGQRASGQRRR